MKIIYTFSHKTCGQLKGFEDIDLEKCFVKFTTKRVNFKNILVVYDGYLGYYDVMDHFKDIIRRRNFEKNIVYSHWGNATFVLIKLENTVRTTRRRFGINIENTRIIPVILKITDFHLSFADAENTDSQIEFVNAENTNFQLEFVDDQNTNFQLEFVDDQNTNFQLEFVDDKNTNLHLPSVKGN